MKKVFKTAVKLTAAAAVVAGATAANAAVDFGKRGEKVDLVIGYQPYYTESWTGVVNNGKAFWKKHLPGRRKFLLLTTSTIQERHFNTYLTILVSVKTVSGSPR